MKRNYTVLFLLLCSASIAGGLALSDVFNYSMIVGAGSGTIFLLCAAFFAGKNEKTQKDSE
ncbi:hypothetical protein [Salimicrobium flavidum]|uniref:Uncharacterized protein n=1 Tax=Salimicrobium flavidum TaxID=570947 RepID=A0A1N7KPE0_9BACI|nr:hypothetical protein [Salimicrobium flavidum]SIS63502.1 hypothetical protein SAMN05421687_11524 [Salimicrobium flavidum]